MSCILYFSRYQRYAECDILNSTINICSLMLHIIYFSRYQRYADRLMVTLYKVQCHPITLYSVTRIACIAESDIQ